MATIIIITLLLVITFLSYKIFYLEKGNIIKEIKEKSFIMDKPVESNPKYSDVDPDLSLLKDTLYSMSIENWKMVKFDYDGESYDLEFLNNSESIKLKCRIREYRSSTQPLYLSWFYIKKMIDSVNYSHVINFDNDDTEAKYLILNSMWKYILDYHKDKRDSNIEHYLKCKDVISKELKSLNRDRKLDDILGI